MLVRRMWTRRSPVAPERAGVLPRGRTAGLLGCLIALLMAATPVAASPRFQPATPADVASREAHTTTLLADGRVLIAGGDAGDGPLATAALFDPVTGTWSVTGSLAVARHHHTATALRDGRVLVVGGSDCRFNCTARNSLASAELYDPRTGIWSRAATMAGTRTRHVAALLPDGRVLVAGGSGRDPSEPPSRIAVLRSAEVYDPVTNTWTAAMPLQFRRDNPAAMTLPDGRVVVMGGTDFAAIDPDIPRDQRLATPGPERIGEIYDPVTGRWTPSTQRPGEAFLDTWWTALPNGLLLGITGSSFEQAVTYDPPTDTWARLQVTGRGGFTPYPVVVPLVRLLDGRVLASGGWGGSPRSSSSQASIFDPATATWTETGSMVAPREKHSAVPLTSGQVLVFGGVQVVRGERAGYPGNSRRARTSELFDPVEGHWTVLDPRASPPEPQPPVPGPCPVRAPMCELAAPLSRSLADGDMAAVTAFVAAEEVTCRTPTEDSNQGTRPVCEGAGPGERRAGYPVGFEGLIGAYFSRGQYEDLLREMIAQADASFSDEYGSGEFRLLGFGCDDRFGPPDCSGDYAILFSWMAPSVRTRAPSRLALALLVTEEAGTGVPRIAETHVFTIVPGYVDGLIPWLPPSDATP